MPSSSVDATPGIFDSRYLAFLETVSRLRPELHRYCARMVGSVLDGEDVVQDALFQAYRSLESYDAARPLRPWLFRIAHNQCIDFLRRRQVRVGAEVQAAQEDSTTPAEPFGTDVERAIERLVLALPPKERACILLKDVLDYSLDEIAELVDSTVGGVKAALSRGRSKLAALPELSARPRKSESPESARLLERYVQGFNQRDWDGLRSLISADARVRIADRFVGRLSESPYFGRYEQRHVPWRLATASVEGEPVVVVSELGDAEWRHVAVIRIDISAGEIVGITDYTHCPWVLATARLASAAPTPAA